MKSVVLIGSSSPYSLEGSYANALSGLGIEHSTIDLQKLIASFIKGGRIGRQVNSFLPVSAWTQKANREAVLAIIDLRPDCILLFCNAPWTLGASAMLKTALPDCKLVLVWPDTVFNMKSHIIELVAFVDLVACYSSESIGVFRSLGFQNVKWIPLAADPLFHNRPQPSVQYRYDITFIGGWRPEREKFLKPILSKYSHLRFNINGPHWHKYSRDPLIKKHARNENIAGKDYAMQMNESAINLNIIDPTNFPAANMRFFEIPVSNSVQFCTPCPEMENIYKNREHVVYFTELNVEGLLEEFLGNPQLLKEMASKSHHLTVTEHTYTHRVKQIFRSL